MKIQMEILGQRVRSILTNWMKKCLDIEDVEKRRNSFWEWRKSRRRVTLSAFISKMIKEKKKHIENKREKDQSSTHKTKKMIYKDKIFDNERR